MALTVSEKAEKLDNIEAKAKHERKMAKLSAHVTWLRVTEFGTGFITSVSIGMLKAAKPAWETAMYGLVIDGTTASIGLIIFGAASLADKPGKPNTGNDYVRELGGGIFSAGAYSLGQKGGAKLYALLTG